jgi:hypothetical protein
VKAAERTPDWVEMEEGETAVGFLDEEEGQEIFNFSLQKSCFSLFHTLEELESSSSSSSTLTSRDQIKKRRTKRHLQTNTMRKTVANKVKPVDFAPSDGSTPDGDSLWREKALTSAQTKMVFGSEWDDLVVPRFTEMAQGSRLTEPRLTALLKTVEGSLSDQEKGMLIQVLFNREAALAWDFSECGRIRHEVVPPQAIRTIPHAAWQTKSIPIPKPLLPKVIDLLQQRQQRGIVEHGHGSYRNNWFLVLKKDGGLRLINDAQKANAITIRDAFTPPGAEEFSEDFGGCKVVSLLDLFSGYDQITLDRKSRDLTTFLTPIGLFRMCTLPMGGTNSVAQFQRAMTRIFYNLIPNVCRVYLDDISIKGPRHDYNGHLVRPGLRRYIVEHLKNIDAVLLNAELAGATIAAVKSQWCQPKAVLLGYLCTPNGRLPDEAKVIKVKEWRICRDLKDVRAFLGLVGFYRIWICGFAIIAEPLYGLTRKEVAWVWEEKHQGAMDKLRGMVVQAPILATLIFDDPRYGQVFLMTDASLEGWGGVIEQVGPDSKRHPCRFESGIWSDAEKRYDATKRELRGLLNLMKRFKRYLFGVHFVIETDALVLVYQLNGAASDIPGSLMMRWIAWIRFFDFTIKHIPGTKNPVADALSRKPPGPSDQREKLNEEDIDDWVDAQIFSQWVAIPKDTPSTLAPIQLKEGYSARSQEIADYLTTLAEPSHIKPYWKRRLFKKEALKFFVDKGYLFKRSGNPSQCPRRLIDTPEEQRRIFRACHDEMGHKGRESTYARVTNHYYWKGMYADVAEWIRACEACQAWDARRFEEAAGWTCPSPIPFAKWHVDIQYMPSAQKGKKCFLLEARDDLTGFVEATILPDKSSASVRRFIVRSILLRWGLPLAVVVDGGSEFKKETTTILENMGIRRISISPYNSRANGINEVGHVPIAASLAKMTGGTGKNWRELLPYVLHADRTAVRGVLGRSPFSLVHNYEPISIIETDVPTWRTVNWDAIVPMRPDGEWDLEAHKLLLTARARMLWEAEHDFEVAAEKVAAAREKMANKRNEANTHRFRTDRTTIKKGDLVLVYNNLRQIDMSSFRKLENRWEGPFRVREIKERDTYFLQTLDGIPIRTPYTPNRVKKFFKMDDVWLEADGSQIPGRRQEKTQGPEEEQQLEEREIPQEAPGRADTNLRLDRQVHSKGKWKQELLVEIPRGKPKGW